LSIDNKVKIVDEQTGRILEGRRYSDGLHQAIEAKENVKVEEATQTYATITLQNYFRMYHKLAGMTGTAETEAGEFWNIYKLDVVVIPTNKDIAIPSLKQYKEYVALVSQAATADPTAKELIDETGRTYTYTRNSAGIYTITVSPAFDDADKVFASISSNAQNRNMAVEVNSTTAIYIYQDDLAAAATDAFDDVSLEIRIY